jgi:hypothetical protein
MHSRLLTNRESISWDSSKQRPHAEALPLLEEQIVDFVGSSTTRPSKAAIPLLKSCIIGSIILLCYFALIFWFKARAIGVKSGSEYIVYQPIASDRRIYKFSHDRQLDDLLTLFGGADSHFRHF